MVFFLICAILRNEKNIFILNKIYRTIHKLKIIKINLTFIFKNYIYINNFFNSYNLNIISKYKKTLYFVRIPMIQLNCKFGKIISSCKINIQYNLSIKLEVSLESYIINYQLKNYNYELVSVPLIINYSNLLYSGQLPKFYNHLYKFKNKNIFLIPTSEVSLNSISFFIKKIFFSIKLICNSYCFRIEQNSCLKNNIGFIRQNQFKKIEIFQIVKKKNSLITLYNMCSNIIDILNIFKIKFRVIKICSNELNDNVFFSFDIEIYSSIDNYWIEISSISLCLDKPYSKYSNKNKVHLLNASCLPINRLIYIITYYYRINNNYIKIPKKIKKKITDLLKR